MVKIIGREWNKFYADESAWPESAWHEDAQITVDGELVDDEFDLSAVPDTSMLTVSGGIVFLDGSVEDISLETHFKRWRKRQTTTVVLVEIPKVDVAEMKSVISKAGWKIISIS